MRMMSIHRFAKDIQSYRLVRTRLAAANLSTKTLRGPTSLGGYLKESQPQRNEDLTRVWATNMQMFSSRARCLPACQRISGQDVV